MYRAAALFSFVFLAACQSPAQRQAADDAYCKSIGATGDMYAQCRMQQDAVRQDNARRSAAMMMAGAQMMSAPPPRQSATTCSRVGSNVVCNTF